MKTFSMRSLPAAVALTAALATMAFAAQAQVGVRSGVNGNIDSDTRMKAENTANGSGGVSTSSSTSTRAATPASGGGVKGAAKRTGHKVEGALERGADATKRGAKRAENAVGNAASRADRGIQGALPANNAGKAPVNVQGTGSTAGQISPPPQ